MTHTKFFAETGSRLYFFDNGYAASRICNRFSYGVEVLVFQWEPRDPTFWEKVMQKLGLMKEYEPKPFYYENLGDVEEDLIGLDNWMEDMHVYAHLNPEQERKLMDGLEKLPKLGEDA